ncbi:MAG: hypothetical protein U0903_15735 [Planctomycetales bacterium]
MGMLARGVAASAKSWGWRTGDTRKLFHVMIFTAAAGVRWFAGFGALIVFGVLVAGLVLGAVYRGPRSALFEALARPEDVPHRGWYVVIPLIATALGGVTAHLLGGRLGVVAFLVSGWGDAVGEPVGIRWGRHRYRILTRRGVACTRSWEGTFAVFGVSFLGAVVGLSLLGEAGGGLWGLSAMVALSATLIETVSPHGWDNFTVPVAVIGTLLACGLS